MQRIIADCSKVSLVAKTYQSGHSRSLYSRPRVLATHQCSASKWETRDNLMPFHTASLAEEALRRIATRQALVVTGDGGSRGPGVGTRGPSKFRIGESQ